MEDEIIHCNFITGIKGIKVKFDFKKSNTAKEIIEKFLKDNNSIMDYRVESITFMQNALLLNKKENLDKPLSKLLKNSVLQSKHFNVKVYETKNIIGGIYHKYYHFLFFNL